MACGDCATVIKRGYLVDKKGGLLVCLYICTNDSYRQELISFCFRQYTFL